MPTATTKVPVTVGILTYNSSIATVEATIKSALDFDEILLCDANSTDGTRELAESFGCRIINQSPEFLDTHGRLINEAGVNDQLLAAAAHEWILFLDHDELATPELVAEIRESVATPKTHGAFQIPRLYVLNGTTITCAAMYPRYQTRLMHRDAVVGFQGLVHSPIVLKDGQTIGTLHEVMLIPLPTLREQWRKWRGYLRLEEVNTSSLTKLEWRQQILGPQWKTSKWIAYRIIKVRRTGERPRLPLSHEISRVLYELLMIVYTGRRFVGLGNAEVRRVWR